LKNILKIKNSFNTNGFCIVKNFYNKTEIDKIKKLAIEVKKSKEKPNYIMKYYESNVLNKNKQILVRAEFFYDYCIGLKKVLDSKKIHKLLKSLMGGDCVLFKEKINYKPSGCRSDKVHQDSQGGWNKYSKKFISILVSIQKSTKSNGCVEFDTSGNNKDNEIGDIFKPLEFKKLNSPIFKHIELNSGDVVFFNHYVPHRSNANKSKLGRMQLYLTYNLKKDGNFRIKYFKEKRSSFPPNIERLKGQKFVYKI
jgi:ectoine hydroxylase-related dioxygenase (phytanoyl-CoA dioxygenase family)